uniref:Uncharacterized protein n=1 Tax=Biomphalaria glabrata TaxID=6526 RepID=A0A2C9M177_BIOGL
MFVMLCVGFGVGALVLVLEHIVYKFLVPYIRQCPEESTWRSVHLMFFSQRNRLADIAKTKRLNRNFCDIVEKAKWLKEMKDSGLTDDDTLSTPTIIEIPLKQLTVNVELGNSCLKLDHIDSPPSFRKVSAPKDSSGESSSAESDDSLLGASRGVSERSLPNAALTGMASPPEAHRTSSRRSQKAREAYRRQRYRKYSKAATASSPDLDLSPSFGVEGAVSTETDSGRHRSLSVDCTCPPMLGLDSPPNNKRHRRSPGSALPSASFVNELSPPCKSKHQKESWDSDRSRFTSSKSNRNEKESGDPSVFPESCDLRLTDDDDGDSPHDSSISPVLDVCSNLLKQKTGDQHNLVDHTECRCDQKALLPKTSNISVSLLHKTRSYQDHLCSLAEASRAEDSPYHFSLDNVTKEELLVLWKSSEIELSRRLEIALKEKAKLERRLAMLQKHSPV